MSSDRGRSALGKGLGALIPAPRFANLSDEYFQCAIAKVRPDPEQPRQQFGDAALEELVASIKEKGILQPLVVRKEGDGFIVVAGERRLRAARKAGLKQIPVLVKDVASDEAFELALIENIQREDLNPIEEANAYQRLLDASDYTQEVLARRLGKNRSTIANTLRLLRLSSSHQQLLIDGTLSPGHARCLLCVDDTDAREGLARRIVDEGLNVREAERAAKAAKAAKAEGDQAEGDQPRETKQRSPSALQVYCDQLAVELSERLGTPVRIKARGRRGQLNIQFKSLDELRDLHRRLVDEEPAPAQLRVAADFT